LFAHRNSLPIVVIRPSQVISAVSEPIEGWVEGMNTGFIGMVCGITTGLLQTTYCSEDGANQKTPVDFVVNAASFQLTKSPWFPHMKLYFSTARTLKTIRQLLQKEIN